MEQSKTTLSPFKVAVIAAGVAAATVTGTHAADERVTLRLSVTNNPVTSNTLVFTAPAAKTITWTNVRSSTSVITNTDVNASATNLFLHISAFAVGTPRLVPIWVNTNTFDLVGEVNQNIQASATGTGSGNWCSLVLSTQAVTKMTTVVVPLASLVGDTNRTNVGSLLVKGQSDYSTNSFATNSIALSNHLSIGVGVGGQTQIVYAPKLFYHLRGTNYGITNGPWFEGITINSTNTNGFFFSGFRSIGTGGNSTQIGSNTTVWGLRAIGIGNDVLSTNTDTIAIGGSAIATNIEAIAIGKSAVVTSNYGVALGSSATAGNAALALANGASASAPFTIAAGSAAIASALNAIAIGIDSQADGTNSLAIGNGAIATATNSMAIGFGANASHTNSVAIGVSAATTTSNQIMLGSSTVNLVQTAARFQAESITNALVTGTNIVRGDIAWEMFTSTTLANGNNIAAFGGTNVFIRIDAGPTAAFTLNGIQGGRSGRMLVLWNFTGQAMTIAHQSGVDPTPANRIVCVTGGDIALATNAVAFLFYDGTASRWILGPVTTTASVTGEANTASNVGDAIGVFHNKSGVDLRFKGFNSSQFTTNETNIWIKDGAAMTNTALRTPTLTDGIAATSFQIPNAAAPTTDAFGEIAGDNNAHAASRGAVQFFDGTANTWLVGVLSSDTPSNGQVPKWNTGGTITWENDTSGAGGSGQFYDFDPTQFDTNTATPVVVTIQAGPQLTNILAFPSNATSVAVDINTAANPNTNTLQIRTNGAGVFHFVVRSNGNVGISTNIPQYKLHVNGDIASEAALIGSTLTMLNGATVNTVLADTGGVGEATWSQVSSAMIANNAVGDTDLRDSAAVSVIGRSANSSGDPADIAAAANGQYLKRTNDTVVFGIIATADLEAAVTRDTEWDTEGEVQTAWGSVNILLETEIDASSELRALMDDETGGGNLMFTRSGVYREIWIPAGAITPATTNGAALGTNTVGTSGLTLDVLDFDDTTEEYGWFSIAMPDVWDLGTVKAKFVWTTTSGTGDAIWGLAGAARSDDDTLNDSILGTAQTVTDTRLADHDQHTTSATAAITIGGTPALGDVVYFRVYRDADAGGDTKTGDARLIGVRIQFLESSTEGSAW